MTNSRAIRSLLLTLVLLLLIVPLGSRSVFAQETAITSSSSLLKSGSYSLTEDIQLENPLIIGEGETVSLYLNGFTLTGAPNASVITVQPGAVLSIYDKDAADPHGKGVITGGSGKLAEYDYTFGGAIFVDENATLNIYGGRITGNTADYASGIHNLGQLNIYDCYFDNNTTQNSAVIFNKGTAVVSGSLTIKENVCENGAGAIMNQGMLSLGGTVTITDNQAGGYSGGLISFTGEEGLVFTGGLYTIENNIIMGDTPADMMYSFWGTTLPFTVSGQLENGSRIGLFGASEESEAPVQVIPCGNGQDLSQFFFSNDEAYTTFIDEEGMLSVRPLVSIQLTADKPLTYSGKSFDKLLSKRILRYYTVKYRYIYSLPEGNYYLTEDIIFEEYTEGYTIHIQGDTSIYLNDKTIELVQGHSSELFKIEEGASLTLYGNGNLKGFDEIASVEGGSFTMNGGTISGNECFGYGVIHVSSGSFVMNGGYIGNNTYYNWSSAVWIEEAGSFTMVGGKITDNASDRDPCGVTAYGSVVLGGSAVISGNTYQDYVGYEPEVKASNLVLHSGASLEISTASPLKAGAKIGITLNDDDWDTPHDGGVITSCSKDVKNYFIADDPACKLETKAEGKNKQLLLTPYRLIELDVSHQFVKIGDTAEYKVMAEPVGLSGFSVSYADPSLEEQKFTKNRPSNKETAFYIVKIERPCDGTYAPVKEYSTLYIGEECTVSFDIESADQGQAPANLVGIQGQYGYLPYGEGISRFGYTFAGWESDGEFYDASGWFEFYEPQMTMKPVWKIKVLEDASYTNGYTVKVEKKDSVTYQWQERNSVTRSLSPEDFYSGEFTQIEGTNDYISEDSYLNMGFEDGIILKGDTFSFDSDANLICYSQSAGTLTREGNHYTYTFANSNGAVRIKEVDYLENFQLSNCQITVQVFQDLQGQTEKTLSQYVSGKTYRCAITDDEGRTEVTDALCVVSFADVIENHWFRQAAYFAAEKGIIEPLPDGTFGPNQTVTVEAGINAISAFADINLSYWFDEDFDLSQALSREDAAIFLYRYEQYFFGIYEEEVGDETAAAGTALNYTDSDQLEGEALEAVSYLTKQGVLSGYTSGAFNPKGKITRAELAQMIMAYSKIER